MAFWNKKKKTAPVAPTPCRHKWMDFPWYYEAKYMKDTKFFRAKIIEPYVCIHCKERKNIVLKEISSYISLKDANDVIESWQKTYKDKIQDKAIVEDMINDMQLVDREYLAIAHSLQHPDSTNSPKIF